MPNPEDRRSALLRETERGLRDSLKHLWPYVEEMRGIEESFSEEERAVISRFIKAAIEATHRHAKRLSRERQGSPPNPGAFQAPPLATASKMWSRHEAALLSSRRDVTGTHKYRPYRPRRRRDGKPR
jgi:hypothetical protein